MDTGDDKSYDDINVTPMVDLYLVLLLIFIIMTTAGVQGVRVDLPRSSSRPADLSAPKSRAITVNNEGKIFGALRSAGFDDERGKSTFIPCTPAVVMMMKMSSSTR